MAATNFYEMLDEALVREMRFDERIRIDLPGEPARLEILTAQVSKRPWKQFDLDTFAKRTPGWSAAKLTALVNFIRKELDDFFSDVRPIQDFRGAICGGVCDRNIQAEVYQISKLYAVNIGLLLEKRGKYEEALTQARKDLDEFPLAEARASQNGANRRKTLMRKRNQAQAALHFFEERSRQEMRNLINIVRKWAERKRTARWTG